MYKKRLAMEQSNGFNDDSVESAVSDPLVGAVAEETPAENGDAEIRTKSGRKLKRKKSVILKIVRKKVRKPKTATVPAEVPGPDEDGEYEVESIVDHKKSKGKTLYRVRWKGYGANSDTWQEASDLSCKDLLKKYKKKIQRDEKDVYVVSKIIDHRRLKGTTYYRVRWENYSPRQDTWQAKETLSCPELLKQYHDELTETILKREEAKLKAKAQAKQSNNEYEVSSIVDSKSWKGKKKYLIRWKGFDASDDTWEPEDTLNCPELIRAFEKKNKTATKAYKAKKRKRYEDSDDETDDENDSDYGTTAKGKVAGGEYEVEKVLNARINRSGKWEFFVMWKGWSPDHNNWEPEENLNCPKLIDQFLGKDKVPRTIQAKLEKATEVAVSTPKAKRKPPSERGVQNSGGLRGRTKGEMKVLRFSI